MEKVERIIGAIVGIVLIVLGLGNIFNAFFGNSTKSHISKDVQKQEELILESSELNYDEWDNAYIEGTIKNNTNDDYSYVQVSFNLFDAEGNQIGTAWTNISHLKANGTWKYKASALIDDDNKIYRYELAKITGW